MKKLLAVVALCAAPAMAFATTASAAGDYPPDDTGTQTDEICAGLSATGDTDPQAGDQTSGDPDGGTEGASFAGVGLAHPANGDDPDCPPETSAETETDEDDHEVTAAVAPDDPGTGSATATDGGGALPQTGTDTWTILRIAGLSLLAGGAFVAVAWWRKRPSLT